MNTIDELANLAINGASEVELHMFHKEVNGEHDCVGFV